VINLFIGGTKVPQPVGPVQQPYSETARNPALSGSYLSLAAGTDLPAAHHLGTPVWSRSAFGSQTWRIAAGFRTQAL
jgi:hypothetical protein